jgi:tRNA pseudouridine55 synthase
LVQFLVGLDKHYLATVRLGFATDTQDITGKQITPLESSKRLSLDSVKDILSEFTGKQLQTPPMFSAKKIAGKRLHRVAREGREIERKPVEIVIDSIELVESGDGTIFDNKDGTRQFTINVRCSSGTYVRTLANDIGARLGVGAHLGALRRTAVGHFKIADALTLDGLERATKAGELERATISPACALMHLPLVKLDERSADRAIHGIETRVSEDELSAIEDKADWVRLCDQRGTLIAVGLYNPAGKAIRPRVVLKDAS